MLARMTAEPDREVEREEDIEELVREYQELDDRLIDAEKIVTRIQFDQRKAAACQLTTIEQDLMSGKVQDGYDAVARLRENNA